MIMEQQLNEKFFEGFEQVGDEELAQVNGGFWLADLLGSFSDTSNYSPLVYGSGKQSPYLFPQYNPYDYWY